MRFKLVPVLVLLLSCEKVAGIFEKHWTYEKPDGWDGLCMTGRVQSPVDIQRTVKANLEEIRFDYNEAPLRIINNGHTIQVNAAGTGGMAIGDKRFSLIQYHFHIRSEHAVRGMSSDMEVHFVHQDAEGNLAVVGVLLRKGEANPLFKSILENAPKEQGEKTIAALGNPGEFLPLSRGYYTYVGSLTTPGCSEGLKWIILKQPMEISEGQIAQFKTFYSNNARPVQALNNRLIIESE